MVFLSRRPPRPASDHQPDGHLVMAMAGDRTFYRIPLDDPGALTEVSVPEPISADGIVLRSPTELAVVATTFRCEEPRSEVLLLESDDGWKSAAVADRRRPSALVGRGGGKDCPRPASLSG